MSLDWEHLNSCLEKPQKSTLAHRRKLALAIGVPFEDLRFFTPVLRSAFMAFNLSARGLGRRRFGMVWASETAVE